MAIAPSFLFFLSPTPPLPLPLRSADEVINPEDYKQLFQLVYSSHRPLATTAGELLYTRSVPWVGHRPYTLAGVSIIVRVSEWGDILISAVRLLSSPTPAPDLREGASEQDTHTQLTTARVRALLHFYQDSEVRESACVLVCILFLHQHRWTVNVCILFLAPSACSIPGRQSVGLRWCHAEGLVISYLVTATGPLHSGCRSVCVRVSVSR